MLIDCGVEVVGRTRFCIHPIDKVKNVTIVGGTKDVKWDKVSALLPDLIILDKEENTLAMAETCPFPYFVLHITSVENIASELAKLANHIKNQPLIMVAERWQRIANSPPQSNYSLQNFPAMIEMLNGEVKNSPEATHPIERIYKKVDYMIWRDPWMAIGPGTFIWSVLVKLGLEELLIKRPEKYPNLGEQLSIDPECFYLFSSEPYPFQKHVKQLEELRFFGAIVDGESFSWYGTRSLLFLEKQLNLL